MSCLVHSFVEAGMTVKLMILFLLQVCGVLGFCVLFLLLFPVDSGMYPRFLTVLYLYTYMYHTWYSSSEVFWLVQSFVYVFIFDVFHSSFPVPLFCVYFSFLWFLCFLCGWFVNFAQKTPVVWRLRTALVKNTMIDLIAKSFVYWLDCHDTVYLLECQAVVCLSWAVVGKTSLHTACAGENSG